VITDYASLQADVASFLNRDDQTDAIKTMIQLAESKFKGDPRCMKLLTADYVIDDEDVALPDGFYSLDSLKHTGPRAYGEIVTGECAASSAAGIPRHVLLIDTIARFSPVPDGTFSAVITYWGKITSLVADDDTNFLLDENPLIYLYGTLVHSAPFLGEDERMAMWRDNLAEALDARGTELSDKQFSGTVRRNHRTFGG
jgi:hypothetical protein